jgi:hypothetical protein
VLALIKDEASNGERDEIARVRVGYRKSSLALDADGSAGGQALAEPRRYSAVE